MEEATQALKHQLRLNQGLSLLDPRMKKKQSSTNFSHQPRSAAQNEAASSDYDGKSLDNISVNVNIHNYLIANIAMPILDMALEDYDRFDPEMDAEAESEVQSPHF